MEKEDLIPITEATLKEMLTPKENVFTQEVIDKIDEYESIANMETISRINKKIKDLISEELKPGSSKADSVSIFIGLYLCFLAYYDALQDIK